MLLPMPLCLNLAVATGWISCLWDVSHLNIIFHVSAGMMRDRSRLCEGAQALEQQLRLLGTERLTVADEIRMHSETVCGCVPRRRKRLCAYCFILLHTKKKKKEEAVCQKEAVCPLKL